MNANEPTDDGPVERELVAERIAELNRQITTLENRREALKHRANALAAHDEDFGRGTSLVATITDVLDRLVDETGAVAPKREDVVENVLVEAPSNTVNEADVQDELDRLFRQGEVYDPSGDGTDRVRRTSRGGQ